MTDKPQNWRCLLNECPTRGKWQAAPEGATAEKAWENHMRREHGWVTA